MIKAMYELTLQPTYYNKGFFNLGVDIERYIRKDRGNIKIHLGNIGHFIHGTMNREDNRNGTPRIYGKGDLKRWFQENFKEMDVARITIINPDEILISGNKNNYIPEKVEIPQIEPATTINPSENLSRLIEIGFVHAGNWKQQFDKLAFNLETLANNANILYAFIIEGDVKYVGKSIRTLKERMQNYKTPGPSQTTNIKNNARIKEALENNKNVKIYAFTSNQNFQIGEFKIDTAAGLEDDIINQLQPEWNKRK